MAKKLSKQRVKDYVDLYLWLKKEQKKPEWSEFNSYIHGKAGYHDVANTYIEFLKGFEAATRGYVENKNVKKAEDLTDLDIDYLAKALSNVSADANLTRFNLMLGNVFGENAGRYKALMSAMEAEARAAKLEELLTAEKAKNEQLRAEGKKVDDTIINNIILALKEEYTKINTSISGISTVMITQSTSITKIDKTNQKILNQINNTKQTVLTELSQIMTAIKTFNENYGSVAGSIANIDVNLENINGDIEIIKKQNEEILRILQNGGHMPKNNKTGESGAGGWKVATFVTSSLAVLAIAGMLAAGTYHDDLANANQQAIYWQNQASIWQDQASDASDWKDKYDALNIAYAQLNSSYQALQDAYKELSTAPSQQILVKYIQEREKLDELLIIVLSDGNITEEEAEQVLQMAENVENMDITISTANPHLGEFITSLLNTVDKFTATVESFNSKIIELEQIIASTDDQATITKLLREKEELENAKYQIISEYNQYKAEHSYTNADVEKIKSDYEAKLKEVAQQLTEAEEKLKNAVTQKEYDEAVANYNTAYQNWQDTLTSYEMYKADTNKYLLDLNNKIATLEETVKKQQKIIDDNATTIAKMQAVIDAYEAQGPSSGITEAQYNAAIAAKQQAEAAQKKAEAAQKKAEEDLAKEQKAHQATKEQLNDIIVSLNSQLSETKSAFANYKATHNYTDAEYVAVSEALDNAENKCDELIERLQNAVTKEEYEAALAELAEYQKLSNSVYEQFYGMLLEGGSSPDDLAKILNALGFSAPVGNTNINDNVYGG